MRMANAARMSPGYISRAELAIKLGISVHEIRRREAQGRIQPAKRVGKTPLYTEEQAAIMKADREFARNSSIVYLASDAKRVFDLLDQDKGLVAIVQETGLHPLVVQSIAIAYAEMGGAIIVSRSNMDKINKLTLDGNFPITNDEDLLDVLVSCSETYCTNCKKRPKVICKHCAPALANKLEI